MEPPYEEILDGLQTGTVIPFLGAGASLSTRQPGAAWTSPQCEFLPSGWELAQYLDSRSGFPVEGSYDLSRIAQYYGMVAGRGRLDHQLRQIFSRSYPPGSLHDYLTDFPNLVIVTTNYDRLIEESYQRKGRPFHVVVYNMAQPVVMLKRAGSETWEACDPQRMPIQAGELPVVFKMHGSAIPEAKQAESYVITEDDYVEFLSRMTGETAIPTIFGEPFRGSSFLFLGYGLRDWNLRVILHRIWKGEPRRMTSWAIQEKADDLDQKFWSRRDLLIFEMTIAAFLERMRETGVHRVGGRP
ncbi:MAG: SIR2 family protein [Bryobacteraceae bacterium]|nr:SIR2 family protein [Bryobacteraceae bacterium]